MLQVVGHKGIYLVQAVSLMPIEMVVQNIWSFIR